MVFAGIPLQMMTAWPDIKNLGKSEEEQKQTTSWSPLGIGITDILIGLSEIMISPSIAIDSFISSVLDFGMISKSLRELFNRLHMTQFLIYGGLAVRADSKMEKELLSKNSFGEKFKYELKLISGFPRRAIEGLKRSHEWFPKLMKNPLKFFPQISSNLLFTKAVIGPIAGLALLASYFLKKLQGPQEVIPATPLEEQEDSIAKEAPAEPFKEVINGLEQFGWSVAKSLYWLMTFSWLTKAFNGEHSPLRRFFSFLTGVLEGMHTVFLSNPYLANFFRTLSRASRTASLFFEQQHQLVQDD